MFKHAEYLSQDKITYNKSYTKTLT